MRVAKTSIEEEISNYQKLYNAKEHLSSEEKERLSLWMTLDNLQKKGKEIDDLKPLILGGYPKYMYDTITPYYQIVTKIFLILGLFLLIISISGFFISSFQQWIGYYIPGTISILFSFVLHYFIAKVKK